MFKHLLLCAALIHCSSLSAFSASVTLQPSEDTSLFETSPDDNLGSSDLASGTTSAGLKSRALVWFDFAGKIPANATVTSVELSFRVTKAPPSAVTSTFGLHRVLQDWAEGTKSGSKIGAPATAGETTWNARVFPDVH
ncbi:MAG: DNRLRE domain-containing protein [Pedosphaera sp.]|nr:DNRLRE domain-containing protein [Pedosphaera sp.]